MQKRRIGGLMRTVALVTACIVGVGTLEADASNADRLVTIPENMQLESLQDSLDLEIYTTYTYDEEGNQIGEYRYDSSGELFYSIETMQHEEYDNCQIKKIMDIRSYNAYAKLYLYTYRYLEDRTLCHMDRYENGIFDYSRGWVWDADGNEKLDVTYDSAGEIESLDCSYYDEEGRLAYSLSGLTDLEAVDVDDANIYSYKSFDGGLEVGYVQEGEGGEQVPCSRKRVIDGVVLMEAQHTRETMDQLIWYSYDEAGRVVYEITTQPAWKQEYSEMSLDHYIYDEQGRCTSKYTYEVVDDLYLEDAGIYSDSDRSFEVGFCQNGYPEWIVMDSSRTEADMVDYSPFTGEYLAIYEFGGL